MDYGLINENGFTFLARTPFSDPEKRLRKLYCPFSEDDNSCGDWCPLFEVEGDLGRVRVLISCVPTRRLIAIDSPVEE